jgi:hypothetical protein
MGMVGVTEKSVAIGSCERNNFGGKDRAKRTVRALVDGSPGGPAYGRGGFLAGCHEGFGGNKPFV